MKRVIIREGVIICGLGVAGVILVWIGVPTGHHYEYFTTILLKNPFPFFDNALSAVLYGAGVRIAFFGYPVLLVIRLIIKLLHCNCSR